jgi:branched-chain amino acid transport system substrate-binding protein
MLRRLTAIVAALVLCLAMALPASAEETIKIAALFNMVGGMASIDVPGHKAAALHVKQINEAGGLLGKKIELLSYDTKTDQEASALAAKKALANGAIAAVGHNDPAYVLPAAPLFQAKNMVYITPGATLPTMPAMVGDCFGMIPFGDDDQSAAIAEYAFKKLGVKKIVVWTDNSMDFTKAVSKFFKKSFQELGGQLLLEDFFMMGDKDFSAQIARLKDKNPDAVFISSIPNEAGITTKQIREAGMNLPIISADGFDTELIQTVPGKALANKVYFSSHTYREDTRPEVLDFMSAYKKEYGIDPENAFAALGYDSVGLLADVIKRAGSTDGKAMCKALRETKGFKGVTGEITFSRASGVPMKPVAIISLNNGNFKVEEVWYPAK